MVGGLTLAEKKAVENDLQKYVEKLDKQIALKYTRPITGNKQNTPQIIKDIKDYNETGIIKRIVKPS